MNQPFQPLDAALRSHLPSFTRKVFRELSPGTQFDDNWHIDALLHQLELTRTGDTRRLIINVPPRSLKSICASVALPAFILGHNPAARIICVSYAQPLAAKLSRDFRKVLGSAWYRRIFPGTIVSKDTEDEIETTKGGGRLATSIGGVVTGLGGDFLIIDDPMKPEEAWSETTRDRVNRYYRETLTARLDSKLNGVIIIVMQRLHDEDLAGHELREHPDRWTHLNLPAINDTDRLIQLGAGRTHQWRAGELLHPLREPQSVLDDLRADLGSLAFESQWLQAPTPDGGHMVKKEHIHLYQRGLNLAAGQIVQSWDTALKGDPSSNYSVCTTWFRRGPDHFLLDVYRKQVTFPELLNAAKDLYQTHRPEAVLIEDVGSGMSLIQQLRAETSVPAIGIKPKLDKETRLSTVLPMFEAKQVWLPEEASWLPTLLQELHGFPLAKHNDQVDSITQYLSWARDRSYGTFSCDWGHRPARLDEAQHEPLWHPKYTPFR
ncbi:MAG: phage terminase large subunit [Sphingomonas sp.]|nr:phage terminase large subunit [Sphingomonas sp.]